MNIPAAALKKMLDCGLSLADAIEVAELMKAPTKGAERQRKFREKQKAESVTCDVTGDADSNVTAPLEAKVSPTPPSKTQTYNLSEPKGSSRKLPAHTRAADFSVFWRAYPSKVAKPIAEKAFGKALAKIAGPDPLAVLLAAIDRYRQTKPPDREWCHPATWLNQERWTDEPLTTSRPGPANDRQPSRLDQRNQRAFDASELAIAERTLVGEGYR